MGGIRSWMRAVPSRPADGLDRSRARGSTGTCRPAVAPSSTTSGRMTGGASAPRLSSRIGSRADRGGSLTTWDCSRAATSLCASSASRRLQRPPRTAVENLTGLQAAVFKRLLSCWPKPEPAPAMRGRRPADHLSERGQRRDERRESVGTWASREARVPTLLRASKLPVERLRHESIRSRRHGNALFLSQGIQVPQLGITQHYGNAVSS